MSDVCSIEYRNYQFMGSHVNFKSDFDIVNGFRGREYRKITPASMRRLKDFMNRCCRVEFATEDIYTPVVVGHVQYKFIPIQEAQNDA